MKNTPERWIESFPRLKSDGHKYNRGHALIYAAPELTGASRLAVSACARIGAGLVTLLCAPKQVTIYRTTLPPHIMVRDDLAWMDSRVTARLYGPGGLSTKPDFTSELPVVLDADALASLPKKLQPNYILTPHEGEFCRAFPQITGTREERAQKIAKKMNAQIVLKGAQTIIAAPDGRIALNSNAPPTLATAGSGDVLAGMIAGLLAQEMPAFEAACAAVWIHGNAAQKFGPGLVANDLPDLIPNVLQDLLGFQKDFS